MYSPAAFPITVIDNFLDNSSKVLRVSEKLSFTRDDTCNWPGLRTQNLQDIEPQLYSYFFQKLFSLWYSPAQREQIRYTANLYFQKITPIVDDPDSPLNTGWVHYDDHDLCAGVVYLEPTTDPSCGTGIYVEHKQNQHKPPMNIAAEKLQTFSGKFTPEEQQRLEQVKREYDSRFSPDIIIPYKFNRLVWYGSQYLHKEQFLGTKGDRERLTLVFFLRELSGVAPPLLKMRRGI